MGRIPTVVPWKVTARDADGRLAGTCVVETINRRFARWEGGDKLRAQLGGERFAHCTLTAARLKMRWRITAKGPRLTSGQREWEWVFSCLAYSIDAAEARARAILESRGRGDWHGITVERVEL